MAREDERRRDIGAALRAYPTNPVTRRGAAVELRKGIGDVSRPAVQVPDYLRRGNEPGPLSAQRMGPSQSVQFAPRGFLQGDTPSERRMARTLGVPAGAPTSKLDEYRAAQRRAGTDNAGVAMTDARATRFDPGAAQRRRLQRQENRPEGAYELGEAVRRNLTAATQPLVSTAKGALGAGVALSAEAARGIEGFGRGLIGLEQRAPSGGDAAPPASGGDGAGGRAGDPRTVSVDGGGPAVTPAEAGLASKPAPDINEPASRIGLYGSYAGPTSTTGMTDAEKVGFENQRRKDIAANVASLEGQTAAIREQRNALRASRGEPLVGENRYTGPAIAGNSRLDEYNQFRANNAASDIPTGLSRGRAARLALQADQLAAETALGQERNRIADFEARSVDQRGRAATAADLLSTQYDAQVDAAKLANEQQRTAISGQNLLRQQREFAAKAPARQLETFEAINAGADLASETLNDRPILKETGVDAGSLYKQIAARVGDPAQANTLLQGFLTSVQERDKLARDAGKKPLDAEVLTLELEDFLGNL